MIQIRCSKNKKGCGMSFEVTADVLRDLREAQANGRGLGCLSESCKRRFTPNEVGGLVRSIEKKLVADPTLVKGPTSLASIGALGILRTEDLKALGAGSRRVAELMCDGGWYTAEEIRSAAGENGTPATEGLRRMRELRNLKGVILHRERIAGSRHFRYRLVKV